MILHKLAVEKGRDPTPSELHLHVHTHDHDGKSFTGERSQIVHERYEEILRKKTESQADIDQCEAYYEAAGGARKKRIYGLGSEAKNYYESKFFVSSGPNASSSVSPLISSAPTTNMSEFVMQLIPALIDHFLPIVLERVHEVISSPPTNNPSIVTSLVPPATTNIEEEDHLVSDD